MAAGPSPRPRRRGGARGAGRSRARRRRARGGGAARAARRPARPDRRGAGAGLRRPRGAHRRRPRGAGRTRRRDAARVRAGAWRKGNDGERQLQREAPRRDRRRHPDQVEGALGKRDAYGPEAIAELREKLEQAVAGAAPGARPALPQLQGRHRQDQPLHLLRLPAGRARLPRAGGGPRLAGARHQVPRPRGGRGHGHALRRAGPQDAHRRGDGAHPDAQPGPGPGQPGHVDHRPLAHAHGRARVPAGQGAGGGAAAATTSWCSTRRPRSGCST